MTRRCPGLASRGVDVDVGVSSSVDGLWLPVLEPRQDPVDAHIGQAQRSDDDEGSEHGVSSWQGGELAWESVLSSDAELLSGSTKQVWLLEIRRAVARALETDQSQLVR